MRRILLSLLLVTACGGETTGPASVLGTYVLQTVNQSPLPFRTERADERQIDIVGGRIVLNANNSCQDVLQFQEVTGGVAGPVVDDAEPCTYTFDDGNLQVTHTRTGTVIPMSVSGNTITAFTTGYTLAYRR